MAPVHNLIITERQNCIIVTMQSDQCGGLWTALEPHLARSRSGVVLDLSRIPFLDSVNIASIIETHNRLELAGTRFAVANMAPNIQAVFRILKLDRMFALGLGLDQAIASVGA